MLLNKFTIYEDEPEKQLKNQNKDISIKISQIEDQPKLEENEIKELESKMKENSKAVDTKICKIEHEISDENEKANEALKIELHDVKNKMNTNKNKLVALGDGSNKTMNYNKAISESKTQCNYCERTFSTNTETEIHIDSDHSDRRIQL